MRGEDVEGALEVVGDGGEVDLDGGFGETSPSHAAQAVRTLPCSEDLLNPAANAMDRLVPFMELSQRFLFVATPCASSDNPWYAPLCKDSVTEMIAAIGAVSKDLAGIVGQCIGTGFAIIDIGRGDRHVLDQRCIGVGTNMGLETMNSPLSLMLHPARVIIVFAGRCDDRGIDQ